MIEELPCMTLRDLQSAITSLIAEDPAAWDYPVQILPHPAQDYVPLCGVTCVSQDEEGPGFIELSA